MRPTPSPSFSLSWLRFQSEWLTQLSRLYHSGIPLQSALLQLSASSSDGQHRLKHFQQRLARQPDWMTLASLSGLLPPVDYRLLQAADISGTLDQTLSLLAASYTRRARLLSHIQHRMIAPLAILFLSLLVNPLPALFTGSLSPGQYLLSVFGPFVALYLFSTWLRHEIARPYSFIIHHLPVYGSLFRRQQIHSFFQSFGWMLQAGLPIHQAFQYSTQTLSEPGLKKAYLAVAPQLANGSSLHSTLESLPPSTQPPSMLLSWLSSGEYSGTLTDSLQRWSTMESDALDHLWTLHAQWLPRLFYACVSASMIFHLIL